MDSDCEWDAPTKPGSLNSSVKSEALKALENAWMISTAPAQVALAKDKKHARKCEDRGNCARCNYVHRGRELAALTPMFSPETLSNAHLTADKIQVAHGCWLASAKVDGKWGLGCIVCCAKGVPSVFGTFSWNGVGRNSVLKTEKLLRHHNSREHARAVAAYFGIADSSLGAPPAEEMRDQLSTLLQGKPPDHGTKSRAMTWCLGEAILDVDREFIRQAKTVSLCRDDRAQRLLMRFHGATATLDVRSGVLGIGTEHREKPDADGLVAATKQVLEHFCTPRREAPKHGDGPYDIAESMDAKLVHHLTTIIEVIAVDEEAAELKAADSGRGRRSSAADLAPITPNLKFVTRDKAHGFRRTFMLYINSRHT